MKRILTALVAAATTVSLSLSAATAAERTSSEVTDFQVTWELTKAMAKDWWSPGTAFGSSAEIARNHLSSKTENATSSDVTGLLKGKKGNSDGAGEEGSSATDFVWMTLKNDVANEWKPGITMDAIIGTTIAVLVLFFLGAGARHLQHQGLIKLPF